MQIVYYSLSGHAERVARQLADMLDLPLYRIEDARPRRGALGFIRSGYEAHFAKCPEIRIAEEYQPDPDHVILVAPVWAGRICSPMRSFCQKYAGRFKRFSLVLTHADQKLQFESARDEIAALTGASCSLFASFSIDDIAPAGVTALGGRLAATAQA